MLIESMFKIIDLVISIIADVHVYYLPYSCRNDILVMRSIENRYHSASGTVRLDAPQEIMVQFQFGGAFE